MQVISAVHLSCSAVRVKTLIPGETAASIGCLAHSEKKEDIMCIISEMQIESWKLFLCWNIVVLIKVQNRM